jgi:hypothetical protein
MNLQFILMQIQVMLAKRELTHSSETIIVIIIKIGYMEEMRNY